jgi:3-oxoadipate enol-lactonase
MEAMTDLAFQSHGQGPCLVLLHAFPLDGRLWRSQLDAFAPSYRVIVPDLRGFGRSRDLGAPASVDQMADDVAALLTTLQVDRAVVAGLSLGGYVALGLLRRHPQRLAKLILSDTRADADSDEARQGRARMLALLHGGGGVAALFEQLLPRLVAPSTGDAIREELRRVALDQAAKTVSGALVAMRDRPDSTDALRECLVPVLTVAGSDDALAPPAIARAMAELAPAGTHAEIPGAGHLSCIENPDIFNRAVLGWLAR